MTNQLLTTAQVSALIGFDERTIRSWCNRGDVFPTARKIPNITTGQWRVLSDDVALLDMLDGHTDNAALLADQNQRIAELERTVADCNTNYEKLMDAYNVSLSEADQLESEFAEVAENYNKLMKIHKESTASHQAQIADLQQYKDHYDKQRQQRRSGDRMAA